MSQSPEVNCINCGEKMSKLISPTAISFKGSGWAKDGYSSTNKE